LRQYPIKPAMVYRQIIGYTALLAAASLFAAVIAGVF
jgi:hypothetical protein